VFICVNPWLKFFSRRLRYFIVQISAFFSDFGASDSGFYKKGGPVFAIWAFEVKLSRFYEVSRGIGGFVVAGGVQLLRLG
jgi:hypothetical protein